MRQAWKWIFGGAALLRLSFGYLDPGSGSFILQIIVAGLLGFLLTIKLFMHRIKALFHLGGKPEADDDMVDGGDA